MLGHLMTCSSVLFTALILRPCLTQYTHATVGEVGIKSTPCCCNLDLLF